MAGPSPCRRRQQPAPVGDLWATISRGTTEVSDLPPEERSSWRSSAGGRRMATTVSGVNFLQSSVITYVCASTGQQTTIIVKQINIQNHHHFHLACKRKKCSYVFHPLSISPKSLSLSNETCHQVPLGSQRYRQHLVKLKSTTCKRI